MSSRARTAAFVAVWSAVISAAFAQNSSALPEFRRRECEKFRVLLKEHTDVSKYDRKHSTNLGIAGVVLFWTGPPGLPLGISAIVMGLRMETPPREELVTMNVTEDSFERINQLCGVLLNTHRLKDVTFRGRNNTAIALGAVAVALAAVAIIIQTCYGSLLCCAGEPKTIFPEPESDEDETEVDEDGQDV